MYSEKILALFKKDGIEIGDKVSITDSRGETEGILMPRPDVGESDIIVIKRDDGYNVGIKYTAKAKIKKKAARKQEEPKSSHAAIKSNAKLPKISLLYTGGTIGSKLDYVSGGVRTLTKPEELLAEVPELSGVSEIEVKNVMNVFSEDITYVEWQKIAEETAAALNKGSRGVIITLGTDTMHYTAAALSFMLQGLNAPVIMTGAQRSSDRGSSDAFINLLCSAYAASRSDIAEVAICMHADSSDRECMLIRGTKARKLHTSRRDAFKPVNNSPIAHVSRGGEIKYSSDYKKTEDQKSKVTVKGLFEPKVSLLKVHPNSSPDVLEYLSGKGYRGVILEGTGLGHTPMNTKHKDYNWSSSIKKAVDDGMIIGMASQCIYGRVNSKVYSTARELAKLGVIYCEDMLPETAYVKLGFLLGNYKHDEATAMLAKNIAGEITERTEADWTVSD